MRLSATMVVPLAERVAIANQNGTYPRVGRRIRTGTRSKFARARQIRSVSSDYLTSTPFQNAT
jgi:hypothetical protein